MLRAGRGLLPWIGAAFVTAIVAGVAVAGLDTSARPPTDPRNGQIFGQANLWTTATEQYAVWVAPDGTPFAGKRRLDGESWAISDLARIPGNPLRAPTADDPHNVYVIAADGLGYVHVVGNMHGDELRYVRSRRPGDLTAWERGRISGDGAVVTYPQLVGLPDGTLLFFRREGSAGEASILLDSLGPRARKWRHLGTVLAGDPSGESAYLHHVAVDRSTGAIHLLFEWRGGPRASTTNDVGYARSDDGGRSWRTSGGRAIDLPVTHASAEIVLDTPPVGSGLHNQGGLTVDAAGRPHGIVVLEPPGAARSLVHLWHDGRRWRRDDLDGSILDGRPAIAGSRDGRVLLLGARHGELSVVDVFSGRDGSGRRLALVPPGWEAVFDDQALARRGRVETLVPEGSRPVVIVAEHPGS